MVNCRKVLHATDNKRLPWQILRLFDRERCPLTTGKRPKTANTSSNNQFTSRGRKSSLLLIKLINIFYVCFFSSTRVFFKRNSSSSKRNCEIATPVFGGQRRQYLYHHNDVLCSPFLFSLVPFCS